MALYPEDRVQNCAQLKDLLDARGELEKDSLRARWQARGDLKSKGDIKTDGTGKPVKSSLPVKPSDTSVLLREARALLHLSRYFLALARRRVWMGWQRAIGLRLGWLVAGVVTFALSIVGVGLMTIAIIEEMRCERWNTVGWWRDTITVEIVQACLDRGANHDGDQNDNTPLHRAAAYNTNPSVIEALIGGGANPNSQNRYGWTPLHSANSASVANSLLDAGADPNMRGGPGETALDSAARRGDLALVQALLNGGADVNPSGSFRNSTPLHAAVLGGNLSVISELLRSGVDPNVLIVGSIRLYILLPNSRRTRG